ncbi:DNA2 [Acanthosepion pharaonis]|uniref:DNA replication ATP-dependent helicase/nuclease n=1 Tax=Acanthosepion pharaonis TaxID=158019 RepID=A0A812CBW2_ACAPH|nr:DNA2 [Sepia pharaonis]
MVKSTKKEVVDNSQSKISSFFGKGTNSNGKLFTTVGSSKLRLPKRKDNVIITDNAPPDKSLPFKASRNPEIHSIEKGPCNSKPNSSTFFTIIQNPAAKNISQDKITESEPIEHKKHSSSHVMNDLTNSFNKSDQGTDQDDFDKQTVKSTLKISSLSSQSLTPKTSSDSEPLLLSSSPTFPKTKTYNSVHVIPETPENKPRKIISRTFLASSAQLKNTVENKINQAKNVELLKMRNKTKRPKPCVANPVKHFDQSVDHILSSSLEKLSPFKPRTKCPKKTLPPVAPACASYNRFQVDNVQHHGNDKIELTLLNGNCARTCMLYGFWCDSHVVPGDVVNVLGVSPDSSGVYHITNQEGLLVINPDTLVSGTSIVSTLFCMRKAILNERFKGIDKGNVHMLYGSVIHCLFQEVMQKKMSEEKQLLDKKKKKSDDPIEEKDIPKYGQGMTESAVMEEIVKYIPSIVTWIQKHTTFAKTPISAGNQTMVTEIRDIEENIWSPRFGMKGKIDLTVEVKIKNKRKKIVPLELKTGRSSFSAEHKGQVTLYSMMSCDRQGDPGEGLLLYLKDQPLMDTIPADQQNKRGLIQLRNELVDYLQNSLKQQSPLPSDLSVLLGNLPEPINNQRACPKCPHLLNCSLYQKSMPQMQPPSRNWSNLLETTLSHLSKPHLDYFVRWCVMMEMENCSKKSGEAVKGIWCSSGIDRELKGECLSNLQLSMSEKLPDGEKFLNTFQRHPLSKLKQEFASLDTIGLCSQESVAVSAESKNQVVLCTGNIYRITPENVVVISDRNLQAEPDFASLVFRVDKCDTYNTWGTCYCNLSILMSDSAHCARLRELIIDHQKPRLQTTLPKSLILKVKTVFKPLNKPQRASVLKVLMSEDYVIVRGYPGTGKTSTIVALIKVLTNLGLSILLASYTHSAVDNILFKLKKEKVEFLRLGRKERIHPEIYPFSEDFLIKSVTNVEELKKLYESKRVVATTCLGSNHVLFSTQHQMFDVCIVDEASQVTQLACIGPLFSAKKFILVGDSKQLPPVVQSKQAKALGMDQSLFELLENQGATVELHLQYRMNSEIMALSNELMYEGCLKCGTVEVSAQTIKLINIESLKKMLPFWLNDILSEDLEKSVVFANTVKVPGRECYNSRGEVMNEIEAHLVAMIVHTLFLAGVSAFEIGVIAPYRNQVKLVQKTLGSVLEGQPVQTVEVNTVDQYQGRDKDVIIVTFVRSQSHNNSSNPCSGELLKDGRRLNVAVTRAKKKLILVGDVTTLEQFEPLAKILPLLRKKNQISFLVYQIACYLDYFGRKKKLFSLFLPFSFVTLVAADP